MKIATTSYTTANNTTDKPVETEAESPVAGGGGGNKGSTDMAKTPRSLAAFYSKVFMHFLKITILNFFQGCSIYSLPPPKPYL